jgi:hypothetical protein
VRHAHVGAGLPDSVEADFDAPVADIDADDVARVRLGENRAQFEQAGELSA